MRIQIGWTKQEVDVDGEKITCEMLPLTVGAMADLMERALKGKIEEGSAEAAAYGIESMRSDVVPRILMAHVRNLDGIEDEQGQPITDVGAFAKSALAVKVCGALLTRLSQISVLTGADEKN